MNGLLAPDYGTAVNGWQDGLLGNLMQPQAQMQPQMQAPQQMPAQAMGVQVPWMFGMLPLSALPTAENRALYPFGGSPQAAQPAMPGQPGQMQGAQSQAQPPRDIWTTRNDNNPDRF